ncbi:protein TolQ [Ketobacter sp.]|uniref:protein TolQ n=1 Tax=Ketobacter sp. TaxID=2083498 RepID=UPI000F18AFB1|nr:protein TolQ [Ketobacter sp.]RLT99282.1 MAG: protein TolQ [Ketobacter sp.]
MSVSSLIADASPLVQGVMLVLLLASLVSWFFIVLRAGSLRGDVRDLQRFLQHFRDGDGISELRADPRSAVAQIFNAGMDEYSHLSAHAGVPPEAVLEGAQRAMRMAIAHQEERLDQALPFLATVGSTSPYIGLFGTVWGIMNSFIGLSGAQQATLAAVAPGIAEALIATAIGLFAAIPAVIAYNRLSSRSEMLLSRYLSFADEVLARLHRRLHTAKA